MSRLSNVGREITSGILIGPANKFVMDNESERMVEASVDRTHYQPGSRWCSRYGWWRAGFFLPYGNREANA